MRHIACVFVGQKYPPEYVLRLHEACSRHMPASGWAFSVLTEHARNDFEGLRQLQIGSEGIKGYWNKLCLFNPKLFAVGDEVLYLDLDVLVHNGLERLFDCPYRADVTMMQDPIHPHRLNSSVMKWTAGNSHALKIWQRWNFEGRPTQALLKDSKGDQAFIEWALTEHKSLVAAWPQDLVRGYYRPGINGAGLPWDRLEHPGKESVIVFHGRPRFHDPEAAQWVKEMWRGLS